MKYDSTAPFLADYRRLSQREHTLFQEAVKRINAAYARRGNQPLPHWPGVLRVKALQDAPGVWEMTWSFAGPDGRATFELVEVNGDPAIRWRRVGGHEIFRDP